MLVINVTLLRGSWQDKKLRRDLKMNREKTLELLFWLPRPVSLRPCLSVRLSSRPSIRPTPSSEKGFTVSGVFFQHRKVNSVRTGNAINIETAHPHFPSPRGIFPIHGRSSSGRILLRFSIRSSRFPTRTGNILFFFCTCEKRQTCVSSASASGKFPFLLK